MSEFKTLNMEEIRRELIGVALERAGWSQKNAAALLGMSSRALNYWIVKFSFTYPSWKVNRTSE